MIDVTTETAITLAQAAELFPPARTGKKTYATTIYRWVTDGAVALDGRRVYLEAVRISKRRWITTREAIQRFVAALESSRQPRRHKAREVARAS